MMAVPAYSTVLQDTFVAALHVMWAMPFYLSHHSRTPCKCIFTLPPTSENDLENACFVRRSPYLIAATGAVGQDKLAVALLRYVRHVYKHFLLHLLTISVVATSHIRKPSRTHIF